MSKRKPVEQKKIEGTYRADRDTGVSIGALDKMPAPDPKLNLSPEAVGLWYSYGNELIMNGMMTFLDLITFSRWCKLYDTSRSMQADIDENGATQITKTNYEQVRPSVGLLNSCYAEMLRIEDRFGLSPVARTKVVAVKRDEGDDLTKILNG